MEEEWTTGHFDATLLGGSLRVGFIPNAELTKSVHAILHCFVKDAEAADALVAAAPLSPESGVDVASFSQSNGGSHGLVAQHNGVLGMLDDEETVETAGVNMLMVQDISGVTLVVSKRFYGYLQRAGVEPLMRWAPVSWRALQIHLGPASQETPGIISYLSSMLSERKISILNFSTFEADLILVREFDLDNAKQFLEECGEKGVTGLQEQIAEKMMGSISAGKAAPGSSQYKPLGGTSAKSRTLSSSSETVSNAGLSVVQTPLMLATIKRVMLKQSMFPIMKQLSRNIDVHLQEAQIPDQSTTRLLERDYLWAYFSTHEEVSLLMDERDLNDFHEDSLVVCPTRWKAIRLIGKEIPFDETGIVRIMSTPYEAGVALLNMSTFSTNVSLVAEDEVQAAVQRLRDELNGEETKVYGDFKLHAKKNEDQKQPKIVTTTQPVLVASNKSNVIGACKGRMKK